MGAINLAIAFPAKYVSSGHPYQCVIAMDVANSEAPLLVSRNTLSHMSDRSISPTTLFRYIQRCKYHRSRPAVGTCVFHPNLLHRRISNYARNPLATQGLGSDRISDGELGRIHLHLGHRREFHRMNSLQEAHIHVSDAQIQEMLRNASAQGILSGSIPRRSRHVPRSLTVGLSEST